MTNIEDIINMIHKNIDVIEDKARKYDEIKKFHGDVEVFKEKAERFFAKTMSVSEVAELYDVDIRTIQGYINKNLIPIHPKSTDGKMLIRVSDVLMLDFPTLRRQVSQKNSNLKTKVQI